MSLTKSLTRDLTQSLSVPLTGAPTNPADALLIANYPFGTNLNDTKGGLTATQVRASGQNVTNDLVKLEHFADNLGAFTGSSILTEGTRTNKCINNSAFPTLTNVGDSANVTTTIIDRTSVIQTSIMSTLLSDSDIDGNVYLSTNTGGGAASTTVTGATGGTNKHSLQVVARLISGNAYLRITNDNATRVQITSSTFAEVSIKGLTPSGAGNQLQIFTEAGAVVEWKLNDMEEGDTVTSNIFSLGASGTRATDVLTAPTTGYATGEGWLLIELNEFNTQDTGSGQTIFESFTDVNNSFGLDYVDTINSLILSKEVGGLTETSSLVYTFQPDDVLFIYWSDTTGFGFETLSGQTSTLNVNTTAVVWGSTIQWGNQNTGSFVFPADAKYSNCKSGSGVTNITDAIGAS